MAWIVLRRSTYVRHQTVVGDGGCDVESLRPYGPLPVLYELNIMSWNP